MSGFDFGVRVQLSINGKLASKFVDNAREGRLDRGFIGLQLHDKGMEVEFKELRLPRLTPASSLR